LRALEKRFEFCSEACILFNTKEMMLMASKNKKAPAGAPALRRASTAGAGATTNKMMHYCRQPIVDLRKFDPTVSSARAFSIISFGKQWVKGTDLTYYCFKSGDTQVNSAWRGKEADIAQVRKAFGQWYALGIGISFREVSRAEDAIVRIGFDATDGSWSYVGRDVLGVREPTERTMNFGWDLTTPYGKDTALHEIGHTLGLEHEHQNPHAGIVWSEAAVRNYFRAAPNNWDDATIEQNILRKIATDSIKGSQWDPNSIMEYEFGPGLIAQPEQYFTTGLKPAGGLSTLDILWARKAYPVDESKAKPRSLSVGLSQLLTLSKGETRLFEFVAPRTRTYEIGTFGVSDTVMVLFESTPQGNVQIAGDDDSGDDRNARVKMRLKKGVKYQIGVRLYYADSQAETSIMVW
jgi:hypothetical protein